MTFTVHLPHWLAYVAVGLGIFAAGMITMGWIAAKVLGAFIPNNWR